MRSIGRAALGLHGLPGLGTSKPGREGQRDSAMARWGLPGSAVLAASVFVGGAVSSPLVAPGECLVRVRTPSELGLHTEGTRGWTGPDRSSPLPRRALSCARPALLPDQALNIWVSRGGPGRVRRSARLESLPTRLPGSRLPFPAASKNGGTPTRTLQDVAFLGCLLPSRGPLSTVLFLKGLTGRRS